MSKIKVTKAVDITVNLGDFQNIKLHSGTERDVEYGTEEERVGLEADIWHGLCNDLTASLRNCLDDLGKETDAPAKFAKMCRDRLEGKVPVSQK